MHHINNAFPVLVTFAFSQSLLHWSGSVQSTPTFPLSDFQVWGSIDGALEDEFNVALLSCQPSTTEGTSSMEGMGAVG